MKILKNTIAKLKNSLDRRGSTSNLSGQKMKSVNLNKGQLKLSSLRNRKKIK